MVVSRRRPPSTPPLTLLLEGHPLEQVKIFKYLGVPLSHDQSWCEHIQLVCSKARKILGLYCPGDFITTYQVIPPLSGHILSMLPPSGPHI